MVLVWVPFKIVSDSPALHSRWLLLLKIEISSIVHCCFSISQNNCSYMAKNSLAYVRGLCLKFFFQPIYTDYANLAYFDKRSHLNLLLWNRWTKSGRDGPSQNCVRQRRPVSKMATVTKNRNFFKRPKLLYFKPECAQIWNV